MHHGLAAALASDASLRGLVKKYLSTLRCSPIALLEAIVF